jgi:hypothetical protein
MMARARAVPAGTVTSLLLAFAAALIALAFPATAAAGEHGFLETFGSAEQPSFLTPEALAVDPVSGDLYVADVGVNEVQSVKVSASAGKFKLKFNGEATGELASSADASTVQAELRSLTSIGQFGVNVSGGPGDASGSKPYLVTFKSIGPLATTDVEQLLCINVSLSGGSGCAVATQTPGIASKVRRFNPDGTPDDFSGLAGNALDGLSLSGNPREVQIAIDSACAEHEPPLTELTSPTCAEFDPADGDIYVPQSTRELVDVFGANGSLLGQLSESSGGVFGGPTCGVGVDPVGAVYVSDASGKVHKFVPSVNPPVKADNTASFTSVGEPCTLAAGTGASSGSIFVDRAAGELFKLNSSTGVKTEVGPIATGVTTVTVDPITGHLFAAKGSEVVEYDVSGSSASVVSSFDVDHEVQGIAAREGTVYVARRGSSQVEVWGEIVPPKIVTEAASPVGTASATLRGTVNPEGLPLKSNPSEGCFFAWGETKSYGNLAPCEAPDAAEVGEGESPVAVHAEISGLKAGTAYRFRLLAANVFGLFESDEDEELTTLGPRIRGEAVSQIATTAAAIEGEVDPAGEATSFAVQYVDAADFQKSGYNKAISQPVPAEAIGSGSGFVPVAQQLAGLEAGTAYHFRIVATNPTATSQGPDETFATFAQPPAGLPDGRAYEMVSPPQKAGEVFPPEPAQLLGSSCPGECMPGVNQPSAPMQSAPDGNAVLFEGQPFSGGLAAGANEYLASRSGAGWGTEGLSAPLFAQSENQGYKAFSEDLGRAIIYQIEPALTPSAPTDSEGHSFANLYLREADGALQPLVGEAPPNRSAGRLSLNTRFDIVYGGANAGSTLVPAFSHIVFAANDALTEESAFAPEAPEVEGAGEASTGCTVGEECNLYEWSGGQLSLINVLPGNSAAAPGVIGSRPSNSEPPASDNAVSADGSRIFWSDASGQLYVRIEGEETREIEDPGRFLDASTDGAKVLLGDGCLYDVEAKSCEDLSEGEGGFQGILGASEDLSRVYFIDTKALSEEENANEEEAEKGQFNLYFWDEGAVSFIGTLLEGDNSIAALPQDRIGTWRPSSARRTAQVSPDGRFLAFMSRARLTGYDNTVSGRTKCGNNKPAACLEVFEYDAEAGELSCASCNPSGQRPAGESNLSLIKEQVAIAAAPFPALHNLTPDGQGRLFFESQDALSPKDANGHIQDVYEWEPAGVGSCERQGGCVYLISSGEAEQDSMFLNSSPSGDDAFFVTRERLLPRDKNDQLDLYDARAPHAPGEALGFPEELTPPCEGEACKGPSSAPPALPGPASSTFSGPGNETPKRCASKKVLRRGKCVKRPKAHKRRRAAKQRRGGSK